MSISRHRALFGVWLVIGAALGVWLLMPGPARAATYAVAPTPCNARPNNGGCASSPTSLTASFPTGTGGGVVLSWATTGRPGGAPRPTQTSATLAPSAGTCLKPQNNQETCTWSWPTELKANGQVLNGAYRVDACLVAAAVSPQDDTTTTTTTTPPTSTPPTSPTPPPTTPSCAASAPTPSSFGVAAPPAPPTGMRVAAASSQANAAVTVTWALGAEPDLSGYVLQRNGQTIASCTLHGAPGAAACGARPSFVDTGTKTGQQTYVLVAERYGLTGTQQIASGPTGATISLGATGPGSSLPPAAVAGTPGIGPVNVPTAPVIGGATPGLHASGPSATVPGYNPALPYGGPANAARALTGPFDVGSSHNRVHTLALIAAGLLVLAVAGHVLYLRGAVARYQAAHADPGAGPVPTAAPPPGRLHIRWGGWPPFYRDPPQPPG